MRFRPAKRPTVVLSYCETSGATERSPHHVRVVGPEGLKMGGGVPGSTLCGRDLRHGWDLREVYADELSSARVEPDENWPGHTCRGCRDEALKLLGEAVES